MKIKSSLFALLIIASFSGCLKDSKQPVSHGNDVNVSLTGSWTAASGKIVYYDATGNVAFNAIVTPNNLEFDGSSSVKETDGTGSSTPGTYNISTTGNVDYITIQEATVNDKYAIVSLQPRKLTLSETISYPDGNSLQAGENTIIYYSSVQINTYAKNDLPRN
ncbi:hypothetical protein [Mucilaginibacter ginsenosidivorans]|uniref:Lipocalin-like domain-containing protein n=1 Tax=Mucilaginibacter ginsenosidivorans TaxID=398053 RepID=A0A5B8UXI6_9SPHI|nr:hypothetical protein [Mucilaginibacter ginsenosidivorans]QEC63385.1 hypothetical protein FRZ54_12630 [Mucilaginibacter ginsenosidivorans]